MKEKLNNYGLWIAMFALVTLIGQDFIPNFDSDRFGVYVDAIMVFVVAAGIVSNPSVGKWFSDKDVKK